jgi:hypothetical protein
MRVCNPAACTALTASPPHRLGPPTLLLTRLSDSATSPRVPEDNSSGIRPNRLKAFQHGGGLLHSYSAKDGSMGRFVAVYLASLALVGSGCTNMLERRVVAAFAAELKEKDLAGLRQKASSDFAQKALQHEDALRAIEQIEIPMGKEFQVTKVEAVDGKADLKRVVVAVGKKKDSNRPRIVYQLRRDSETAMWRVDDLFLDPREISESNSVGLQLQLMAAARQACAAFQDGSLERIAEVSDHEFTKCLSTLPEAYISALSRRVASDVSDQAKFQPEIEITGDLGMARFSRVESRAVFKFERKEGQWLVTDAGVEDRRETNTVPSIRALALATRTSLGFLAAYSTADKTALAEFCDKRFFETSLAGADLKLVSLPGSPEDPSAAEVQLEGRDAAFVVRDQNCVTRLSLKNASSASGSTGEESDVIAVARAQYDDPSQPIEFRVSEVTLFELNGTQNKRLSALFTAHEHVKLYCQALLERDVDLLRSASSKDFNTRVWNRLTNPEGRELVNSMPLPGVAAGRTRIVSTVFRGPVTTVLVEQGSTPMTLLLRDQQGDLRVDDVQTPPINGPESLKLACEAMIPALEFARSYSLLAMSKPGTRHLIGEPDAVARQVERLRALSSKDFCRVVWLPFDARYKVDTEAVPHMKAPISKVDVAGDRAVVVLGTSRFGTRMSLVRDQNVFTVDEVELIRGVEVADRRSLKQSLRSMLAEIPEGMQPRRQRGSQVIHAGGEMDDGIAPRAAREPERMEPVSASGK